MTNWINLVEAMQALREGDGAGVPIAIIDSGIEVSHPQLGGIKLMDDIAIIPAGHKLTVVPGNGLDVFGHGTAIASTILSLAPRSDVGSIRVLGEHNESRTEIIQRGVQEALDRGYKVLNCSFGCQVTSQLSRYKSWVDLAYLKGVHVVAACNNYDYRIPEWPAYFPSVIAVNMTRTNDDNVFFYRKDTLVEFAAKGIDVRVPWRKGEQKVLSGSSYAVPRLAALLARLLSVFPQTTPLQAKAILHKIAKPWHDGSEEAGAELTELENCDDGRR
jgi:subtilisin family serine protease